MKKIKLLSCCSLVLLWGCAGSGPVTKANNDDKVREGAEQAYVDLDVEQTAAQSLSKTKNPKMSVAVESNVLLLEKLHSYACPNADDLRGQGIADNANSALAIAQREISAQIQSVVVAKTEETRRSNVDIAGNETLQSSFQAQTQVFTRLQNAQDAKSVATLTQAGKFGVVACMTKSDAAKPFIREAALLQDSVKLALKIFEEQKHPVIRNNAFKSAQETYWRMLAVEAVLDGLGNQYDNKIKSDYESALQIYNDFRSHYAFYYQAGNESDALVKQMQRTVFERLSARYPIGDAKCSSGLLLKLDVSLAECVEKSLGITCTANLNMSGSSCDGESYFSINAKVKGNGRYDTNEAKERLNANISNGDWFNDWTKELDKWRLE